MSEHNLDVDQKSGCENRETVRSEVGKFVISGIAGILAMVAGVISAPADAAAQSFYFGIHAGRNFAFDGEFNNSGSDLTFDPGYAYGAVLGYDAGNRFRLEGALTYRGNTLDSLGGVPQGGKISSTSAMVNSYYDFMSGGSWTPYLGGGVGIVRVEFDGATDAKDWVAGYQLIAGLGFNLSTNTVWTVDYRYFGVNDPKFETGGTFSQELAYSTAMIGIRSNF